MIQQKQTITNKNGSSDPGRPDDHKKKGITDNPIITKFGETYSPAHGTGEYDGQSITPYTDRGVTVKAIRNIFNIPDDWEFKYPTITDLQSVGLHYLTITLYCPKNDAFRIYMELLFDKFGELDDTGYGLTGFRSTMIGQFGFKIAYDPVTASKHNGTDYVSFIIPGAACERLYPDFIGKLGTVATCRGIKIKCTRIDYKFDQVDFSPYQFRWMIQNNVTYKNFQNDKVRFIINDENNELGNPGKITVYTGSLHSERMICCYDTHGFTRLEVRNRGERANLIFLNLQAAPVEKWNMILLGHLQDYVCFDNPTWRVFVGDTGRAYMTINQKPDPTLDEMNENFIRQYGAILSILYDLKGSKWLDGVLQDGREKRKEISKYQVLLHRYGINDNDG